MKPIVTVSMKLAACLTIGVAGVIGAAYAASFVVTDYKPHHFAHMDAPLWTDRPIAIDRNAQTLERLPAMIASADVPAQEAPLGAQIASAANAAPPQRLTATGQMAQAPLAGDETNAGIELSAAHSDWCFARYRSYRIEDNSYQPFDALERQQCQSPHEAGTPVAAAYGMNDATLPADVMTEEKVAAEEPQMIADSGSIDTSWCFAQYRSYRAEDNSYQPFDGGPRRQCVPRESSY